MMEPDHDQRTPSYLLSLSPDQFEDAIARLLPFLGYQDVQRVGGAGDLGADIVCSDADGRRVVVQCKRFAPGNNVTSPNIQQFFGMLVHHGAHFGLYVTTSGFTKSAADLAAARDIRTIDGAELAALFAAHPDALGLSVREAPASPPTVPIGTVPQPAEHLSPMLEPTATPAVHALKKWRCLGCCQHIPASIRTCPACLYTLSPRLWKQVSA